MRTGLKKYIGQNIFFVVGLYGGMNLANRISPIIEGDSLERFIICGVTGGVSYAIAPPALRFMGDVLHKTMTSDKMHDFVRWAYRNLLPNFSTTKEAERILKRELKPEDYKQILHGKIGLVYTVPVGTNTSVNFRRTMGDIIAVSEPQELQGTEQLGLVYDICDKLRLEPVHMSPGESFPGANQYYRDFRFSSSFASQYSKGLDVVVKRLSLAEELFERQTVEIPSDSEVLIA